MDALLNWIWQGSVIAAVTAMVKRGLIVHPVTPEVEAEWIAVVDKLKDQIRGKLVPADMFDEAQRLLTEHRAGGGTKPK